MLPAPNYFLAKINAFCKLYKINPSVLNKILNQQTNFKTLNIFRIARVMNIHIKELFIKNIANPQ